VAVGQRLQSETPRWPVSDDPDIFTDASTQVRAPFDRPGWVYEEKIDGYRMLAYRDGSESAW